MFECVHGCEKCLHKCLFSDYKWAVFPCVPQGYERVRRNSEEELYLMRADDMEEGSSHSDLSTSGEHQTEEVTIAKQLGRQLLIFNFVINNQCFCFYCFYSVMLSFVLLS